MKPFLGIIGMAMLVVGIVGCQVPPPKSETATAPKKVQSQPRTFSKKQNRTDEQMKILREFAVKESPKIWQTIQSMRSEIVAGEKKIKQLRADFLEFGRNPDTDEDYRTIVTAHEQLCRAYDTIFDRLEDAYIAAKKYEAYPSRKDYQDTMKRAIEDGIQEANFASKRYKTMSKQK